MKRKVGLLNPEFMDFLKVTINTHYVEIGNKGRHAECGHCPATVQDKEKIQHMRKTHIEQYGAVYENIYQQQESEKNSK